MAFPQGSCSLLPSGGKDSRRGTTPFCVSATLSQTQASFLSSDPPSHVWGDRWLWTRIP